MTAAETDPFVDPQESIMPGSAADDLYVEHNACLSLGQHALLVSDAGLARGGRSYCCGLYHARTPTTCSIPFRTVLSASIDGAQITIVHALATGKDAVRPAYISYALSDKTAQAEATSWKNRLLALAYQESSRARRLKVLINPHGGQGRAARLYAQEAEPIFRAAGCEVDVETTTHRGHAQEIARDIDVDRYDAIVCCSGDGTPHEVFNGLAQHPRPSRALRKLAVTQLPGGSGNALSLNVNGTNSISLAALAIVKAERRPLDLISISQGEQRYLSFLSQAVGIIAEVDLGTEHIRWMGSARFTYGFLVRLLGKTVYPAEVSVKVELEDKNSIRAAYQKHRDSAADPDDDDDRQAMDDKANLPAAAYGSVNDPVPGDWLTMDMPELGNFYCGNMVHMSPDTPFFSAALPNDGLMDLVDIVGTLPRTTSVDLMMAVENNKVFNKPEVRYRKVKAYRITPRLRPGQTEGYISIDGERVPFTPFQAEVLPGLGTVLAVPGQGYHWDGPPPRA